MLGAGTSPRLSWSDFMTPDEEYSGNFFTSVKFLRERHRHDFYEFCFVTKGSLRHEANGERRIIGEGELLFIRPDDEHSFAALGGTFFRFVNLAVRPSAIAAAFAFLGSDSSPNPLLESAAPPGASLSGFEAEATGARLEAFVLLTKRDRRESSALFRISLVSLLANFYPPSPTEGLAPLPTWLDRLCRDMRERENFIEGIAAMPRLAGKSPEHICREFKRHLGLTPTEFVNDARLGHAERLLSRSDESVIDIAFSCGFSNLSHFNHRFKARTSMSPTAYRDRHQRLVGMERR